MAAGARAEIHGDRRHGRYIWEGATTLLLTTTVRRSGESRTTPLIYGRDGDRYLVVASRGGAPEHPGWYQNLAAHPEIQVQVMADRFRARARTATVRGAAGALEDDGRDLAGLRRIPGQDGARDPGAVARALSVRARKRRAQPDRGGTRRPPRLGPGGERDRLGAGPSPASRRAHVGGCAPHPARHPRRDRQWRVPERRVDPRRASPRGAFPPDTEGDSAPGGRRAAPGARDVGTRRVDGVVRRAAQRLRPARSDSPPTLS